MNTPGLQRNYGIADSASQLTENVIGLGHCQVRKYDV
jgi:hypothetical protein